MQIRSATADDVDAVLAFWQQAAQGRSVSDDREGVLGLVEHDPQALLIADDEGVIVGTVIAGWDGWRCHIYRLAVLPSRRREGIGRALVAMAEARFTAAGGRRSDAMVLDDNDDAQQVWRGLGYAREDHWSRWVRPIAE
jgi:ribosomal protein S18 acetylase RimI-like enzyme